MIPARVPHAVLRAQPETCLVEVLATWPEHKMLAELAELMGESPELLQATGTVERSWRALHALQTARPVLDGELADVEDLGLRSELERRYAACWPRMH